LNADADIWIAFARTFGVLFMALALLLFVFYLIRRFLVARVKDGTRDLIRVLTVHHLSPKEKLVLVTVLDETILIGVTPNQISKIAVLEKRADITALSGGPTPKDADAGFSDLLNQKLGHAFSKFKKTTIDTDPVKDA